ncbi:MAG: gamma-glutamyltransferase [Pseudomonadota bacterium]
MRLLVALALIGLFVLPFGRHDSWAAGPVVSEDFMASTANPLATKAARDMIVAGGSAVDAAIAAQMVLGLVEPQSSGIGGGAFLLFYDADERTVTSFDGRETAPLAATPALFLEPDGEPMSWTTASEGGLPVGTPGVVKMLEMVHARHGKLPWADLFEPAIGLAENGFTMSPRLHEVLDWVEEPERFPTFFNFYFDHNGERKPVGTRLVNPDYAATLRQIAEGGADAFYEGPIAESIVAMVEGASVNPGLLALDDFAAYQAKERPPVCAPYRVWKICGMGPPSSGGITVLQILLLLENHEIQSVEPASLEAVHMVSEASRLAYADRNLYIGDNDFVAVPIAGLLDKDYLAERATLIDPGSSMGEAEAGTPPDSDHSFLAPDPDASVGYSTSHVSIVDRDGNAVSMTTSIEQAFGSRLMVDGFMLNNELTDFSFVPEIDGQLVANRVEPGKRPRSSMAPMIVLDQEGRLVMAVGTVGGSRIIAYVAKTVIANLDWGLDIQAAIELPHHVNRNGTTELEDGTSLADLQDDLEDMGHDVSLRVHTTGLHGFHIVDGVIYGGADPRREGTALGQ